MMKIDNTWQTDTKHQEKERGKRENIFNIEIERAFLLIFIICQTTGTFLLQVEDERCHQRINQSTFEHANTENMG